MILVVDNYDSFTFNLVQALEAAGAIVRVVRNDAIDVGELRRLAEDPAAGLRGIVISPGPGDPSSAGISVETIRVAAERRIPLLGVCLGMQSMAVAFGASIVRAPTLVHGEASSVEHDGAGLLAGLPMPFDGARYHSLCVSVLTPQGPHVLANFLRLAGEEAAAVARFDAATGSFATAGLAEPEAATTAAARTTEAEAARAAPAGVNR